MRSFEYGGKNDSRFEKIEFQGFLKLWFNFLKSITVEKVHKQWKYDKKLCTLRKISIWIKSILLESNRKSALFWTQIDFYLSQKENLLESNSIWCK